MSLENEIAAAGAMPFRLGEWLVEPRLNRLTRDGESIQLELKVMDVLVCLAERAGEVVTRIELVDRVWATEFICDNTLTRAINQIRMALGDDARNPSYIETIHRRGYRLMVPVTLAVRPPGTVAQFPSRARPDSDEDLSPYPGLAAFTEADADFFFGREAEVAQIWRKLTSRRLLAVIGPSGVGKSSFLRAGVIPAKPEGWGVLVCQPGEAPFAALARALVPEFKDDSDAIAEIVDIQVSAIRLFTRWRERYDQVLLIVDQFEELFTLNSPETQQAFSEVLGRLARNADVHVLLSLRDDFLYRCHPQPPLRPIFEDISALEQPNRASLRRAVVEPARRLGYTFEDDSLVDGMLDEIAGERSALPLLAFAVARLWEKRDQESHLLTLQAHEDIGGVGGALARHAEGSLRVIGENRREVVRELFRNLVTAEGTRAVRSLEDLVSVYPIERRQDATEVIRQLVDARLVTSFEGENHEGGRRHRIEVVHESLLTSWPRLVGWRTQDADSARLRDELRQAAKTWDEHDRTDDFLWSGRAFREYALWRESYPGGLSDLEEAFATAMTSFATRRRRRRRIAAAAAFALLLAVLGVVGTLWQRSVRETLRAEASKLLAHGEVEIETYPTAALAWATASLELADSAEGRKLALRALHRGAPLRVFEGPDSQVARLSGPMFSPNGEWLAYPGPQTKLWHHDGGEPIVLETESRRVAFAGNDVLVTYHDGEMTWWSIPEVRERRRVEVDCEYLRTWSRGFACYSTVDQGEAIRLLPFEEGASSYGGVMDPWRWQFDLIDDGGTWLAYTRGNRMLLRSLEDWGRPPRVIGELPDGPSNVAIQPGAENIATWDSSGDVLLRPTSTGSKRAISLSSEGVGEPVIQLEFDPPGKRLAAHGMLDGQPTVWLWDLTTPRQASPLGFRRSGKGYANPNTMAFHPSGEWLVASNFVSVGFWPVNREFPRVFQPGGRVVDVKFTPDGSRLVTVTIEGPRGSAGQVRVWPLDGQNRGESKVLYELSPYGLYNAKLAVDPSGTQVAISTQGGKVLVLPLSGEAERSLEGRVPRGVAPSFLAFSPDGSLLAAAPCLISEEVAARVPREAMVIRVWDLDSGASRALGQDIFQTSYLGFVDDRRLLWVGRHVDADEDVEKIFDLEDGTIDVLAEGGREWYRVIGQQRTSQLTMKPKGSDIESEVELFFTNLETGEVRQIVSHGDRPSAFAMDLDPSERWLATGGHEDGMVRVGSVSGEEPHLLFGHDAHVSAVEFSPDGRWIASSSYDKTVRLWPMPDMSRPPLHTLPLEELIAKLKTLTNLRAVRDESSATGWKIEVGPFPGWAEVPEW